MSQTSKEAQAVASLFDLKTEFEQSVKNFKSERDDILKETQANMAKIREVRENKAAAIFKLGCMRGDHLDLELQVGAHANHITQSQGVILDLNRSVHDQFKMNDSVCDMEQQREKFEQAFNFYSVDSLNLENMKRRDKLREKRVELTDLTLRVEKARAEIEELNKQRERAKLMELEKARQEEELKKKLEEEKILAEKERQRQQFLQKRVGAQTTTEESKRSFRVTFERAPELSNISRSHDLIGSPPSPKESLDEGHDQDKKSFTSSLSQFLRW